MDDNKEAASILADIVHTDVYICDQFSTQNLDQNLSVDNLGVWIDPIGRSMSLVKGESNFGVFNQVKLKPPAQQT